MLIIMKRFVSLLFFSLIVVIPLVLGMASPTKIADARENNAVINIETEPSLEIHEGYVSQKDETVLVKQGRKIIAKVHLSEPVMIAQADREEEWGYFQFPNIGRAKDGTLIISWQMNKDSHKVSGVDATRTYRPMMSKDGGLTWAPQDKNYFAMERGYNVLKSDGSIMEAFTPESKNTKSYLSFPKPIVQNEGISYYNMNMLPDELQGFYYIDIPAHDKSKIVHAKINDPNLLRYSIDGLMPVVWRGNIFELSDKSLIAGVYPAIYLQSDGRELIKSVSFYRSQDDGFKWDIVGTIPFRKDGIANVYGENGYSEPAFTILRDSTFVCVMRSGSESPMYITYSHDFGQTWEETIPFTPNGVKPRLLLLDNGVLVLASGRPGIQIRFSLDGRGKNWTVPIDMIPFMNTNGKYNLNVSCGYASILEKDADSFYLVYSDFTKTGDSGIAKKSIWCRTVRVVKENRR